MSPPAPPTPSLPLKMALPKGRLLEPALALFRTIGIAASEPATTRKLLVPSSDGTLSFLFVKPGDVPVYVESGAADLGITGTDVLREKQVHRGAMHIEVAPVLTELDGSADRCGDPFPGAYDRQQR